MCGQQTRTFKAFSDSSYVTDIELFHLMPKIVQLSGCALFHTSATALEVIEHRSQFFQSHREIFNFIGNPFYNPRVDEGVSEQHCYKPRGQ